MFPNVDVLGALASTNDAVPPLDARGVVLVHRSRVMLGKPHILEEDTKIQDLRGLGRGGLGRGGLVLCLGSRQRCGFLHLRAPRNRRPVIKTQVARC